MPGDRWPRLVVIPRYEYSTYVCYGPGDFMNTARAHVRARFSQCSLGRAMDIRAMRIASRNAYDNKGTREPRTECGRDLGIDKLGNRRTIFIRRIITKKHRAKTGITLYDC